MITEQVFATAGVESELLDHSLYHTKNRKLCYFGHDNIESSVMTCLIE